MTQYAVCLDIPPSGGRTVTNIPAYLANNAVVNVLDFGATGDGTTDDTAAISNAKAAAISSGRVLYFPLPSVAYRTAPLVFTAPQVVMGSPGVRLKLNTAGSQTAVITVDFTGGAAFFNYGMIIDSLILDGNGLVADGLLLKSVISSRFDNIRATNTTVSGFHLAWAQLCTFTNPTCSANVEAFTTTPANGILVDGATSSANTFIKATVEHVSGSGIKLLSLGSSGFYGGTSEGNAIGVELGETVSVGRAALNNVFECMDLEVNTTADAMLRLTASGNMFIGCGAGYMSGATQLIGAKYNYFVGGQWGAFSLDSNSARNRIIDMQLYGAGNSITDAGPFNSYRGVFNITDGVAIPEKQTVGRSNNVPANAGTVTADLGLGNYIVITATASVSSITIGAPANATDAAELEFTIHNTSGGALTTTWNAAFHFSGWTDPATGKTRSARFRYDANYAAWYCVAMSATDQPA